MTQRFILAWEPYYRGKFWSFIKNYVTTKIFADNYSRELFFNSFRYLMMGSLYFCIGFSFSFSTCFRIWDSNHK